MLRLRRIFSRSSVTWRAQLVAVSEGMLSSLLPMVLSAKLLRMAHYQTSRKSEPSQHSAWVSNVDVVAQCFSVALIDVGGRLAKALVN
jgi:hypothetical protein